MGWVSFTLDTAMPELNSPTDLETKDNEITFKWDNKTQVDNFEIWIIGPNETFKDNTNTNRYVKKLSDGSYTWKVRSFDTDNSHFSDKGFIYIDTGIP